MKQYIITNKALIISLLLILPIVGSFGTNNPLLKRSPIKHFTDPVQKGCDFQIKTEKNNFPIL